MTDTPTPLTFRDSGAGWHLKPRRRFLLIGAATVVGAVLALAGLRALLLGKVAAGVLLLVLAAAVAVIPFGNSRRRLPPATYDGPEGRGTLLPIHAVRVVSVLALLVFGLLLVVAPALALREVLHDRGGDRVLGLVISVFVLLLGLLLLVGAYGGVRSRMTPSKGILLTPTRVVLRTQTEPMVFGWEAVRGVWPHWTRQRAVTDLIPSPDDPIHNWLSFEVTPGAVQGLNALGRMARTEDPTLDAEKIASDPHAVVAFCRFYLAEPEARAELGTPAALARFRDLVAPVR
ncbi:hypothetical protein [Nocardioides lijunqiniae]|uniref:hypothetical protein n=1 Tax=Nocardioides lijunqiniae TaxID=2760832 RepID=UPI00187815D6|nr:hypothetical protein [Nocardioides lijunqiniae]